MDCFEGQTFLLRISLIARKVGKRVIANDGKYFE